MAKKPFTIRQAMGDNKYYIIVPDDYEWLPPTKRGTYAVAPARVLGLKYHEYLMFVKTLFPDKVILKGEGYVVPYWEKNKELYTFVDLLNKKVKLMQMNEAKNEDDE